MNVSIGEMAKKYGLDEFLGVMKQMGPWWRDCDLNHNGMMSHAPILQNNIILFDFIPRHYVKFYAKL